jgi:hypothetical protein
MQTVFLVSASHHALQECRVLVPRTIPIGVMTTQTPRTRIVTVQSVSPSLSRRQVSLSTIGPSSCIDHGLLAHSRNGSLRAAHCCQCAPWSLGTKWIHLIYITSAYMCASGVGAETGSRRTVWKTTCKVVSTYIGDMEFVGTFNPLVQTS